MVEIVDKQVVQLRRELSEDIDLTSGPRLEDGVIRGTFGYSAGRDKFSQAIDVKRITGQILGARLAIVPLTDDNT